MSSPSKAVDVRSDWIRDYRSARLIRPVLGKMPEGRVKDAITLAIPMLAFVAAGRIDGRPSNSGDPLAYSLRGRLCFKRGNCRMPLGPRAALQANCGEAK